MFTLVLTVGICLLLPVVAYLYYKHRKNSNYIDWQDTKEFYDTVYTEEYRNAFAKLNKISDCSQMTLTSMR